MNRILTIIICFLIVLPLSLFFSCTKKREQLNVAQKPKILVTLLPYKYLVEKIGGESLEVITFVPKKRSAHSFTPSLREIEEMGQASIWFRIGEPIETKPLAAFKKYNPQMKIINLSEEIDLLPFEEVHGDHVHAFYDPHFWLSPTCLEIQVKKISEILIQSFPEKRELYEKKTKDLLQSLANLDKEISRLVAPLKTRSFLTSHSSFGYFCRDYNLHEIPVEYKGKEPTLPELENLLSIAKQEEVKLMILISQEKVKGGKLVADYLHLKSVEFDHLAYDVENSLHTLAELLANQDEHNSSR